MVNPNQSMYENFKQALYKLIHQTRDDIHVYNALNWNAYM